MNFSNEQIVNQIKSWTPPVFHQASECYISFSAFSPETGRLKMKKIMLGRIKGKRNQKLYADGIMQRLTEKLINGWNPWIEQACPLEYTSFTEVCDKYHDYLFKLMKDENMREDSVISYLSYLRIMREWVSINKKVYYIYQFDKKLVGDFLDYVYIDRENSMQTRNNYLCWVKVFCSYLLERSYIKDDPTQGFSAVHKRGKTKNRDMIPAEELHRIRQYLLQKNKHYLLACYILNYLFVRPKEMSYIKICDINLTEQTVLIHGQNAKNHNDAVLTLPAKVIHLMLDLDIFNAPGCYYLFSDDFRPGVNHKSEKCFRDYWTRHVRKDLKFSVRYKFYSLKDTGITNMIRSNTDILSVRDQARHSSILITDTYTPKDIQKANKLLLNYDGEF